MDPQRWAEITRSFDFNPSETLVPVSSEKIVSGEKNENSRLKGNGVLHTNCNELEKPNGYCDMQLKAPSQAFTNHENLTVLSGNSLNAEDSQGKVIENLCKIVKEKAEKIKVQQKLLHLLNDRLQNESSYKDSCVQTDLEWKDASDTYGSKCMHITIGCILRLHAYNLNVMIKVKKLIKGNMNFDLDATSVRKIVHLIGSLERRLNLVINFIQRKFPKDVLIVPDSDAEKKERIESVFRRTWDKPPAVHPRPTYGSLMREIHSRNRIDKERSNLSDNAYTHTYRHATRSRSKEDYLERRIEVLESLVVLLKGKIMKKINSRRK